MTDTQYCPGGCGQPLLFPVDNPQLCVECVAKGVKLPEPVQTLFGHPDDEYLDDDIDSAIERAADRYAWTGGETCYAGATYEIEVSEFSVLPKGQYGGCVMPSGAVVAQDVVERWLEETTEEMYEQLAAAARTTDVVAAFQMALDLLASKSTFLLADKVIATHRFKVTITDDKGNWDYEPIEVERQGSDS